MLYILTLLAMAVVGLWLHARVESDLTHCRFVDVQAVRRLVQAVSSISWSAVQAGFQIGVILHVPTYGSPCKPIANPASAAISVQYMRLVALAEVQVSSAKLARGKCLSSQGRHHLLRLANCNVACFQSLQWCY